MEGRGPKVTFNPKKVLRKIFDLDVSHGRLNSDLNYQNGVLVEKLNLGKTVVVREIWNGRIWSGRPFVLVEDEPDMLVMFMPAGTRWIKPVTLSGGLLRIPKEEWKLAEARIPIHMLVFARPGADHSIRMIWAEPEFKFVRWYVNLEQPLARTKIGFDYMDHVLDIVVNPDFSGWKWKDEDELQEAIELGLLSCIRADQLRTEGMRVLKMIEEREHPFDGSWLDWCPDPHWQSPELPQGWNDTTLYPAGF